MRCRRHASADNTSRDRFLKAARVGLAHYPQDALRQPAERRLAFRELGLALGLHAVEVVNNDLADGVIERRVRKRVEPLLGYLPLRSGRLQDAGIIFAYSQPHRAAKRGEVQSIRCCVMSK